MEEKLSYAEILRSKISSSETRRMIFDGLDPDDDILGSSDFIIPAINNLLITVFFVAYSRWAMVDDFIKTEAKISNNVRINKIFNNVFFHEEVNLDLIVFALTEIIMDVKSNNNTLFGDIVIRKIGREEAKCTLLYDVLKTIKVFADFTLEEFYSYDKLWAYLIELLDTFKFLKFFAVTRDQSGAVSGILRSNFDDIKIDFGKFLIYSHENEGRYYYLSYISKAKDSSSYIYKKLELEKASVNADEDYESSNSSNPDILIKKVDERFPELNQKVDYITKILSVNYKYLKECALVFSDSITKHPAAMEKIISKYVQNKYKGIFSEKYSYEIESGLNDSFDLAKRYYWDNIVTVLLVELGPTDFIKEIIDATLFEYIIDNISKRYYDSNYAKEQLTQVNKEISEASELIDESLIDTVQKNNWKAKQNRNIWSAKIIEAICSINSAPENEKTAKKIKFIESIHIKYKKIEQLIKNYEGNIVEIYDELKETLRFILCYYSGILRYAERKKLHSDQRNCENCDESECNEAFKDGCEEEALRIKDMNLVGLNAEFIKLNEKFIKKIDCGYQINKDNAAKLFLVISRKKICDIEAYLDIISIDKEAIISKKPPENIFEMIETIMDRTKNVDWDEEQIALCCNQILEFYIFLIYNGDKTEKGQIIEVDTIIDPIYPYVVSYYEKSIDRDLYKKCSYKIPPLDGNSDSKIVKLLTDKEYDANESYYCTPRKEGSTRNWWINPFMIPTHIIDDIFKRLFS